MRRVVLLVLVLLCGCRRETSTVVDASPIPTASSLATANLDASAPTPPSLDDRCARHSDCEKLQVFTDGEWRCCLACEPKVAANKASTDGFLAACARTRKMSDCPVLDCAAPSAMRAACVGGHCVLAPAP